MTLAQVLKKLMETKMVRGKPISANELSRETGVPQSTITRILNEDVLEPRKEQLQPLADFFGVSLAELRGEQQAKLIGAMPTKREAGGESYFLGYVSELEMKLLQARRSANEVGKKAIDAAVLAIAKQSPATTSGKVIKIR
jgi:transcriptional regulator with XRE-family HTH domain